MSTGEKSKEDRLPLVQYDAQGDRYLDLIRVSDAFRRKSEAIFVQQKLAEVFNAKATKLSKLLHATLDGKYDETSIKHTLKNIVLLARDNGVEEVRLPVSENNDAGKYLYDHIMVGDNFSRFYNIRINLQSEPYQSSKDIVDLGEPDDVESKTSFSYKLFEIK